MDQKEKYEEDTITDKIILDSKINVLHDKCAETSISSNEILKKENIQAHIRNKGARGGYEI